MKRLLVLFALLLGGHVAIAQPVPVTWRPPTTCSTNDFLKWNGTAWVCSGGAAPSGSGTANTVAKWTGTTALGNSSLTDDGTTILTGEQMRVGTNSSTWFGVGRLITSTTAADTGWRVFPFTDNNIYIDSKLGTSGSIFYRTGQGTEQGDTRSWLTVIGSNATATFSGLLRADAGTSSAGSNTAGTNAEIEGAAATNNYLTFRTADAQNSGVIFNNQTGGTADGYILYENAASAGSRKMDFAVAGTQYINLTSATTAVHNALTVDGNTTLGDANTDTTTVNGKLMAITADAGDPNITPLTSWSNRFSVFGPNAASNTGAALGIGYNTSNDVAEIAAMAPNTAWKSLRIYSNGLEFYSAAAQLSGAFSSSGVFTTNGNAVIGDNSGTDSLTVKQGASGSTTAASSAGTILELGQVDGTNNYLTFRGTGQAGLRVNNASGAGDVFFVADSSRNLLWGTAGTVRVQLDSNGSTFTGDTTNTAVADGVDVLTIGQTGTGQTTSAKALIQMANSGTYNTTSSILSATGIALVMSDTRSAGSNNLNNVGFYSNVTGGQTNTALVIASGLLQVQGPDPTMTCGTSATIVGSDVAGTVTVGTGSPATCVVTFAEVHSTTPTCVVTPQFNSAIYISGISSSNFTISPPSGTFSTSNKINYVCFNL